MTKKEIWSPQLERFGAALSRANSPGETSLPGSFSCREERHLDVLIGNKNS